MIFSLAKAKVPELSWAKGGSSSTPNKGIYDDHNFSTKYKDRILQVIQRKPGSDRPVLRARSQNWDGQYDMLVLTLELSDAVKPALEKIIKAWLVEGETFEKTQAMLPLPTYKTAGPAPVANDDGE